MKKSIKLFLASTLCLVSVLAAATGCNPKQEDSSSAADVTSSAAVTTADEDTTDGETTSEETTSAEDTSSEESAE